MKRSGYAAIVVVITSAALVASSLVVVPWLSTGALEQHEARRIVTFQSKYDYDSRKLVWSAGPVKLGALRPDESATFLSPFSKDMEVEYYRLKLDRRASSDKIEEFLRKSEAYSRYILLRLPEWLGGKEDQVSSYRAYSALAISNSCVARYWGQDRWAIEDPCHGDRYRPWDGLVVEGPAAVGVYSHSAVDRARPVALADIDLGVDEKGYLVAFKPDPAKNGSVGAGKTIDVDSSTQAMLAAASKYAGYDLPFPASVLGMRLAKITPAHIQPVAATGYHSVQFFSATYYSDPGFGYGMVEMTAYPVDQFPELVRGSSPLNMTAAKALAGFDPFMREVRAGPGVAGGQHGYLYANESGDYAVAAVLGEKSGTAWFVAARASGTDAQDRAATAAAKSIKLD